MSYPFNRTTRAQSADSGKMGKLLLASAMLLLILFSTWSIFARVPLYVVSPVASLKSNAQARAVVSQVEGRLLSSALALGSRVEAGDVLLSLDPSERGFDAALSEAEKTQAEAELQAVEQGLLSLQAAKKEQQQESDAALAEAAARVRSAQESANMHRRDAERALALWEAQAISRVEYEKSTSQSVASDEALAVARAAERRIGAEQSLEAAAREEREAELMQQRATLKGTIERARIATQIADTVASTYLVRAPAQGVLSAVRTLTPDSRVQAGDTVAVVLPEDHGSNASLRAEAWFTPAAFGQIRSGQRASIRLDGYPWIVYGALSAQVDSVGSSIGRDGFMTILQIDPSSTNAPLAHDLPGSVEIEVGEVSPLSLLLRRIPLLQGRGQ